MFLCQILILKKQLNKKYNMALFFNIDRTSEIGYDAWIDILW